MDNGGPIALLIALIGLGFIWYVALTEPVDAFEPKNVMIQPRVEYREYRCR